MPRKLPDLSTTQLIASAAATAVAALGASYLGVYGTIIGAALMSLISTAGSAVGKHYLDQGRDQIKELTHLQTAVRRRTAAESAADEARSADPTRTAVWSGDPNATRFDPFGDPNATRLDPGGDPGATRRDPVDAVAGSLAGEAGEDAVREVVRRTAWQNTVEWAKAHWAKLAVSSAAVFAIVIGGITAYEAATGEPIGGGGNRGLTVTNVVDGGGGQPDGTPSQDPSGGPTEPGTTPSQEPTGDTPSTDPGTPAPQPTDRPTEQPTQQPTTPVPTAPATPAPTGGQQDGGAGGGQGVEPPQTPAG
ncbi:hypothetical protein [Actinomadura latina]|uniref:Uncharacterized protein n=1 Tax=Actinomadura latina TaxID=163603 RepID=A0A846Z1Y4_9ACTN|nr:hypothetical protein [Actinomadura latina]NKZ04393.1 hypothetical protein [Actinomadura latina]